MRTGDWVALRPIVAARPFMIALRCDLNYKFPKRRRENDSFMPESGRREAIGKVSHFVARACVRLAARVASELVCLISFSLDFRQYCQKKNLLFGISFVPMYERSPRRKRFLGRKAFLALTSANSFSFFGQFLFAGRVGKMLVTIRGYLTLIEVI